MMESRRFTRTSSAVHGAPYIHTTIVVVLLLLSTTSFSSTSSLSSFAHANSQDVILPNKCSIPAFFPFSGRTGKKVGGIHIKYDTFGPEMTKSMSVSYAIAAQMAVNDFNNRFILGNERNDNTTMSYNSGTSLIPELKDLEYCPIRIDDLITIDSKATPWDALKQFMNLLESKECMSRKVSEDEETATTIGENGTLYINGTDEYEVEADESSSSSFNDIFCGILGPAFDGDDSNKALGEVAGTYSWPKVNYLAGIENSNPLWYDCSDVSISVASSSKSRAIAILSFLHSLLSYGNNSGDTTTTDGSPQQRKRRRRQQEQEEEGKLSEEQQEYDMTVISSNSWQVSELSYQLSRLGSKFHFRTVNQLFVRESDIINRMVEGEGEDDEDEDDEEDEKASDSSDDGDGYDVDKSVPAYEEILSLKGSGHRIVFLLLRETDSLIGLAKTMDEFEMLNGEYLFLLHHEIVPVYQLDTLFGPVDTDSSLSKLLVNSFIIDQIDPFEMHPNTDPFLQAWKLRVAEDSDILKQFQQKILPTSVTDDEDEGQEDEENPPRVLPTHGTSYVYDAVMTLGFGACNRWKFRHQLLQEQARRRKKRRRQEEQDDDDNSTVHWIGPKGHDDVLYGVTNSSFSGVSGPYVRFRKQKSNNWIRDPHGYSFGAYTVRAKDVNDVEGTQTLEAALVGVRSPQEEEGAVSTTSIRTAIWQPFNDETVMYTYANGLSGPRNFDIVIQDANYLSKKVRMIGIICWASAWVLSLTCMLLLFYLRNDATIKMNQPFFMALLCVGSVILSTSILALSWDEGAGLDQDQLTRLCMATPWFFFVGQVISFSALFTKLWRLDRVMQFSKRRVSIYSAMGPLFGLTFVTCLLLVLWTVLDPWTWEREILSEVPFETYGECRSDNFWAYFGPLMIVLVLVECLTAIFAQKTSDVPGDLRESAPVLLAIIARLQAWLMGVPILSVLNEASANGTYFGRILLIWVFSVSSVCIDVGPKVIRTLHRRWFDKSHRRRSPSGRVYISGLNTPAARHSNRSDGAASAGSKNKNSNNNNGMKELSDEPYNQSQEQHRQHRNVKRIDDGDNVASEESTASSLGTSFGYRVDAREDDDNNNNLNVRTTKQANVIDTTTNDDEKKNVDRFDRKLDTFENKEQVEEEEEEEAEGGNDYSSGLKDQNNRGSNDDGNISHGMKNNAWIIQKNVVEEDSHPSFGT